MAPGRLQDKVSIVTGSSSGLGRAIAQAYSREGALLVCVDLSPAARDIIQSETNDNTDDLIRQQGGQAIFVKADVTKALDWENVVAKAVEKFGRIDVLVNNAGISYESKNPPRRIHDTPEEAWDITLAVNGKSVWLGCKYALGQMLKQEPHSSGDRGWIINLSSIFGLVGARIARELILVQVITDEEPHETSTRELTNTASYAASKGAVTNLTRSLALDYAQDRIHVNALNPGFTRTGIFADTVHNLTTREDLDALHPFGGTGVPEDIAVAAVFLASSDARWVTGVNLPVDGGFTAQ